MNDRRYQVFVSSTFTDLQAERQGVLKTLLELGCFPAGMEFFPAADSTAWAHIERVIDDSDYYVVVVGGRYGSITSDGLSFTQREYEYAHRASKPILAFLHADPGAIPWRDSEQDPELRTRLEEFVSVLERRHLVKTWTNVDSLRAVVATGLTAQMESSPQIGWTRNTSDRARRTTGFEVVRHKETLVMRPDGFDNELTLDIRAAASGLEVFFRQSAGAGSTRLQDIELLTPSMTLLRPFIVREPWSKAFVYLGRQLAQGESTTVSMREVYQQPGAWDAENLHGYYTAHPLQRLELEVVYPDELRPTSAVWREYQGEMDMGDVIAAGEMETTGNVLRYVNSDPQVGHNYVIEWTMPHP